MKNFILIKDKINVEPLLTKLGKCESLWDEIKLRQDTQGSPHKYTRSIFLRWSKDLSVQAAFTDIYAVDYPALAKLPEAEELIGLVLNAVKATRLGRVLITSLQPGGVITPHCDEGQVAAYYERFHIPLYSEDGNEFHCESEEVHMKAGELWCFNNKKEHWLSNKSEAPRMHLIVDAESNYCREILNEV